MISLITAGPLWTQDSALSRPTLNGCVFRAEHRGNMQHSCSGTHMHPVESRVRSRFHWCVCFQEAIPECSVTVLECTSNICLHIVTYDIITVLPRLSRFYDRGSKHPNWHWNLINCPACVTAQQDTAYPKLICHITSLCFCQICTCSCCSFISSPLCFFLIGGILSSSPLSLSLFFWCSSHASSVFVFSLRAFCRRWSRELWCCNLTSSSFMYWRTMSMVNCEKLSCPAEKAVTESWDCWWKGNWEKGIVRSVRQVCMYNRGTCLSIP